MAIDIEDMELASELLPWLCDMAVAAKRASQVAIPRGCSGPVA